MEGLIQCVFDIYSFIPKIIKSVIKIFLKILGLDKISLENIKKRYEFFKDIIINKDNKVLAYTGIKEYIEFSISDALAEYILTSTKFFDIVNVLKITHDKNIDYDSKTKKITYKRKKIQKTIMVVFIILSIIVYVPVVWFMLNFNKIIEKPGKELFLSITLVSIFIIMYILCAIEVGNRKMIFNLVKKLNNEDDPTHNVANTKITGTIRAKIKISTSVLHGIPQSFKTILVFSSAKIHGRILPKLVYIITSIKRRNKRKGKGGIKKSKGASLFLPPAYPRS